MPHGQARATLHVVIIGALSDNWAPNCNTHEKELPMRQLLFCSTVVFLLPLLSTVRAAEPLAGSRPNIILVMTDDQGYGQLGRHGHPWLETPNLDRLYDTSTRFTRFLVSPTCSPTRSAIMTGRHPLKNGVTHTILERERMTLDATTLPQVLKTVGYTTGIFGKWHLGDEEDYQPHKRGFDEAFIHGAGGIGQAYACSCADAPNNKYFDPVIRHNGSFVKTQGFCTDLFFDAAMGWIQKKKKEGDQPFFAYLATNAPHGPFLAPPKNTDRFKARGFGPDQAGFYGMIENIDENIGRLMAKLEELQLLENTLVIFMSDNGTTGGGSGKVGQPLGKTADGTPMMLYNAGMKGLKGSADEGGVRVPFFVRWDGRIQAGVDVDRIAAHLDILPTLAALAGAKIPTGQVEGRNLLPLINDPKAEWSDRYLFTHVARWPTGKEPNDSMWKDFAVRNARFRLVKNTDLYDMLADPGQTKNVIDQHPEVAEAMRAAYEQFWNEARPLMVNETAAMSPTRPFHVLYEEQLKSTGIPDWRPE
jgi:arylsulfatase A-like enzyme